MSNGGIGNGIMDASGTIDPSALNSAGTSRATPQGALSAPHPTRSANRALCPPSTPNGRAIAPSPTVASVTSAAASRLPPPASRSPNLFISLTYGLARCPRRPTPRRRTASLERTEAQSLPRKQLRRLAGRPRRYVFPSMTRARLPAPPGAPSHARDADNNRRRRQTAKTRPPAQDDKGGICRKPKPRIAAAAHPIISHGPRATCADAATAKRAPPSGLPSPSFPLQTDPHKDHRDQGAADGARPHH